MIITPARRIYSAILGFLARSGHRMDDKQQTVDNPADIGAHRYFRDSGAYKARHQDDHAQSQLVFKV